MKNRLFAILDHAENLFLQCLFLAAVLTAVYMTADAVRVYHAAGASKQPPYEQTALPEEGSGIVLEDFVGRIAFAGTAIDHPIMQGRDNVEYLNKAPNGEYSLSGSVFLDADSTADLGDAYSILYAHHMAGDAMFGALDRFESESYFEEHASGILQTKERTFRLQVYAFLVCDVSDPEIFGLQSPNEEREAFIREHALLINEEAAGEHLIALTTCRSPGGTDRTVLLCRRE